LNVLRRGHLSHDPEGTLTCGNHPCIYNNEQLEHSIHFKGEGRRGTSSAHAVLIIVGRQMLLLLEPAVECEARLLSPKVGRRSILERGRICATALLLSLQVYKRKPVVDGSRAQLNDGHNHLLLLPYWHCGAVGQALGGRIVSTANTSSND